MKHGLGPKPGPGNIWISAVMEQNHLCIRIEDDGMGPPAAPAAESNECHGLSNVAGRLRSVYGGEASVELAPRQGGGACVTVRIPKADAA